MYIRVRGKDRGHRLYEDVGALPPLKAADDTDDSPAVGQRQQASRFLSAWQAAGVEAAKVGTRVNHSYRAAGAQLPLRGGNRLGASDDLAGGQKGGHAVDPAWPRNPELIPDCRPAREPCRRRGINVRISHPT